MAAVGVSVWVGGTTGTSHEMDGEAGVEVDAASGVVSWFGVLELPRDPANELAAGVSVAMPSVPSVRSCPFIA